MKSNLHTYIVVNEGYIVEVFIPGNRVTRTEALEEAEKEIRRELLRNEKL